ncbi:MAG: SusC/RagA family TonB-linked outer membrane protein [Bacteroidales bacterium]|nr:SusC/RagA family TonB-linked outer membrane protein [Bacteroidales bacterium]
MRKLKVFLTALLILVSSAAFAQKITVTGVVTDASNGEPLSGAAILVKGTPDGVVADNDGRYSITVSPDATLGFTTIGYVDAEISVDGRTVINVNLEPDSELLEETIVVAFGTSTKESFTGSASVVNSEKLSKSQVSAVTSALAGQVAGVQLAQSSGDPTSKPSIRIRGYSSISAKNEPLYIVDGVPYDGDINNINPNDVENTTVLKDAASNALYGARGANGVIIITTKKAKSKDAVITFDAKLGVNQKALKDYDLITDPGQFYEAFYAGLYNYYVSEQGFSPKEATIVSNNALFGPASAGGLGYQTMEAPAGQLFIGYNGKLNPNAKIGHKINYNGQEYYLQPDRWNDYAYRNSLRQEYNLSVAGGGDKTNIYASLAYLDNQGITANSDFKRLTARLRAEYQAKSWLKVTGNMSYAKFDANSLNDEGKGTSTGNIWAFTSQIAPIYPLFVRDGNGNIMNDAHGFTMYDYGDGMNAGLVRPFITNANPLQANRLNTNNSEGNAFNAQGVVDITFLKYFKFTVNGSGSVTEARSTSVSNPYYGQFAGSGGTVGKSHARNFAFNTQQLLNYTQSFGKNNVNVMVGHEYYNIKGAEVGGSKQQMFSQDNKELDGAVIDNKNAYSYTTEYNTEGFLGRAQYDYDNRIFASASYRRDASSRFDPLRRWGNFWSAGAAWIISKENWFNASWVDLLKLKASYGENGNDNLIGEYMYTDTYNIVPSDGKPATMFNAKGNPEISWEKVGSFNTGVEFELFHGVLDGSVEYFYRNTHDMLFRFTVAKSLGYSSFYKNVGDMYNKGLEFNIGVNIINTNNINWRFDFNATTLKNKVTYLHPDVKTLTMEGHDGYTDGSYFYGEDLPIYTRYLKSYAGVDPETGESLWWKDVKDDDGNIVDREKTNVWSQGSYYLAKSSIPDVYGGFGTSLKIYGFDFSINFSYQLGGMSYDDGYETFMGSPTSSSIGYGIHKDIRNAWTPDNKGSNIPRFQYADEYTNGSSDRFLTSASYLNIENLNFGYTFPGKWTKKFGVEALRIYFAAQNLGYISARQGFDPRYSFEGTSNATVYQPIRTLSGGLNIKF